MALNNLGRFALALREATDAGEYAADMHSEIVPAESCEAWLMHKPDAWRASWTETQCNMFRQAFIAGWTVFTVRQLRAAAAANDTQKISSAG